MPSLDELVTEVSRYPRYSPSRSYAPRTMEPTHDADHRAFSFSRRRGSKMQRRSVQHRMFVSPSGLRQDEFVLTSFTHLCKLPSCFGCGALAPTPFSCVVTVGRTVRRGTSPFERAARAPHSLKKVSVMTFHPRLSSLRHRRVGLSISESLMILMPLSMLRRVLIVSLIDGATIDPVIETKIFT